MSFSQLSKLLLRVKVLDSLPKYFYNWPPPFRQTAYPVIYKVVDPNNLDISEQSIIFN